MSDFSLLTEGFPVLLPRQLVDEADEVYALKSEVIEWVQYSINQPWHHIPSYRPTIYFKDKAEAALFKLFWL
jgi:hypothetical protein